MEQLKNKADNFSLSWYSSDEDTSRVVSNTISTAKCESGLTVENASPELYVNAAMSTIGQCASLNSIDENHSV